MRRTPPEPTCQPLCCRAFTDSIEELETRLEAQLAGSASHFLDDNVCLYYLCTMRCETTRCTAFLAP